MCQSAGDNKDVAVYSDLTALSDWLCMLVVPGPLLETRSRTCSQPFCIYVARKRLQS